MEKILSNDDKIKRAEEIYYRRKMGIPNTKFSKMEGEKKSYLGSKILLEILIIINCSVIIMAVQNRNYIFTEQFLGDIQNYNINITRSIKELIGIDSIEETVNENNDQQSSIEEIVPNEEGQASSLNQMDQDISKIKELITIQRPIAGGTVTSRFGTRESSHKNVEGYHTGIDIGAEKRNINLCSNFSEL